MSFREISDKVLPKLQPIAERLKKAAIEWINTKGMTTPEKFLNSEEDKIFIENDCNVYLPSL